MDVERKEAEAWLGRLAERPARAVVGLRESRTMPAGTIDSIADLRSALEGSPLVHWNWRQVPVVGCDLHAWVAATPSGHDIEFWRGARERLSATGLWPVLWAGWGDPDADAQALADELFSRWEYELGPASDDVSPPGIASAAHSVDVEAFLDSLADDSLSADDLLEIWRLECERIGLLDVDLPELWSQSGQDRVRVERILADRERALGKSDPERGRQGVFRPADTKLVLLPTARASETLAYIHWYGMGRGRPEAFVRVLQSWSDRFGAELYAHYGTMLEFDVSRPPSDLDAALELALEHERIAPCTLILPGIALRHYAEGLIGNRTWFLHERP